MKITYTALYNIIILIGGIVLTIHFNNSWYLLLWVVCLLLDVEE